MYVLAFSFDVTTCYPKAYCNPSLFPFYFITHSSHYFPASHTHTQKRLIPYTTWAAYHRGIKIEDNYVNARTFFTVEERREALQGEDADPVPAGAVVMSFSSSSPGGKKQQEHELLSTQRLVDLRDCLYCVQNHIARPDEDRGEERKEEEQEEGVLNSDTESFFFIEDTFYVEKIEPLSKTVAKLKKWLEDHVLQESAAKTRRKRNKQPEPTAGAGEGDDDNDDEGDGGGGGGGGDGGRGEENGEEEEEENEDDEEEVVGQQSQKHIKNKRKAAAMQAPFPAPTQSSPTKIRKHVKKEKLNFSPFSALKVKSMDEILSSIQLRVGVAYLYCHQGRCEHWLHVTDVHLHCASFDAPCLSLYPRLVWQTIFKRRSCSVCNIWSANCIVYGDRLSDKAVVFYCEHCYHALHYTKQGELLYDDFVVVPYLHDQI